MLAERTTLGRSRPPTPRRGWVAKTAQVIGELLITVGVIILLFAVYELKITDIRANHTQQRLERQLGQAWERPPTGVAGQRLPNPSVDPQPGAPLALLRIPRLGDKYSKVVVEGVGTSDLQKGPGHYPKTALPGAVGNSVISGHRTTYGHPFYDLDKMKVGDEIDVQVRYRTYHYRVTGIRVVSPDGVDVLLPVPGHAGVKPTQRLLTFTTCTPRFSAAQRLIVTAEMAPNDYTDATGGA